MLSRSIPLTRQADGQSSGCLHHIIEATVRRARNDVAVVQDTRSMTYAQLNCAANRLAGTLRNRGVGPDVLVGIYGRRTLETVIGILATLKAGGAYVPLDANYPAERLRYMVSASRLTIVLKDGDVGARDNFPGTQEIQIDSSTSSDSPDLADPSSHVDPDNLALVIYTSGSTGRPKGIALTHRGITDRLNVGYGYRQHDVQKASISVGAHVSDMFLPLVSGGPLLLLDDDTAKDVRALAMAVARLGTSRVVMVPSHFAVLADSPDDVIAMLRGVDTILVSGDMLPHESVRSLAARAPWISVINAYGASEAAGLVLMRHVTDPADLSMTEVVPGYQVHLLDDTWGRAAVGDLGEVCFAGDQLARGYLHDPRLTAERFIPNPFAGHGTRMYRTRDLARQSPTGAITIVGRANRQVKVQGLFVDLGEVEALLDAIDGVATTVVLLQKQQHHERLIAYMVPQAGHTIDIAAVRERMRNAVPEYMVPARFQVLSALPFLPNGKVDRQQLAATADSLDTCEQHDATDGQPRTETELSITSIWTEVLQIGAVGLNQDFFDVGGNSVLAGRVLSRVAHHYGVSLTLRQMFQDPTIKGLARLVDNGA
jgi:amino acid adenylation domain-containing protein